MSKSREEIQQDAIIKVMETLSNSNSCSLIKGTGVGKTYTMLQVIVKLIEKYNYTSILWLTNSEDLRDVDTPNEFIKWGYEHLLEYTDIVCYQTACRWKEGEKAYDIVIADEADFSLTDKYSLVYENVMFEKRLLATASIRDDQQQMLNRIAPICFTFTTQDAQDSGIVNKTKFVFVRYLLSSAKTYRKTVGKKSWLTSENENYEYIDKTYTKLLIELQAYKKQVSEYNKNPLLSEINVESVHKKIDATKFRMKWINNERYKFLNTLDSSKAITRRLLNKIHAGKGNKAIVFSSYTSQIDSICKDTYHSNNKDNNNNIVRFNNGDIDELGVCSIINRGKNLNGANHGLFESYDGSHVKGQQRVGRFCRLLADNDATIWVMIPFFKKKVKVKGDDDTFVFEQKIVPTRAVAWADSMLSDFRLDDSNFSIINEDEL